VRKLWLLGQPTKENQRTSFWKTINWNEGGVPELSEGEKEGGFEERMWGGRGLVNTVACLAINCGSISLYREAAGKAGQWSRIIVEAMCSRFYGENVGEY